MRGRKGYIERDFEKTVRGEGSEHLLFMMRDRLARMTAENSCASKQRMRHLKEQILPAVAVFQTLCSVMPEEEAFAVVRGYILNQARKKRRAMERFIRIPGAYRLMPWATAQVMKLDFNEAAGFERTEIMVSRGVWRVDMTKCPYHDVCKQYGCERLCALFCETDDICNAELHPKLIWHRTKTLGRGDDCCDFCLKIRTESLPAPQKKD